MNQTCAVIVAVSLLIFLSGCQRSGGVPAASPTADASGTHDHDHEAHSHGHAETGPRGGHLLDLGSDCQAEWLHDDQTGLLTIHLLAKNAQNDEPPSAQAMTIELTIGDNTRRFELQPANAADPASSASGEFSITDRPLIEALKAVGHGVDAALIAEVNGQTLRGQFEHLDHDHDHAH